MGAALKAADQKSESFAKDVLSESFLLGSLGGGLASPRLSNNRKISPLQDARNYDMELFAGFLVRCASWTAAEGGDFFGASGWA
jgi:hypothetical protein